MHTGNSNVKYMYTGACKYMYTCTTTMSVD